MSLEESLAGEKEILYWSHKTKKIRNCADALENGAQMIGDRCLKELRNAE